MNLPGSRRKFLYLVAGTAAVPAVSRIARAQAYPARPVRVIVGFAAGGSADIIARLMGHWLSERLGQQFIIENRPGAGTNIATAAVAEATPDGYTLLLVTAANFINATLYENLNFNFIRDIAPVASLSREPSVMVVNPSVPANTVLEFIAYAKANPGKITMASGGNGAPSHVSGTRRSQAQSAACRYGRNGAWWIARRIRKADCPGNREVGQGRQVLRRQGRLIRRNFGVVIP